MECMYADISAIQAVTVSAVQLPDVVLGLCVSRNTDGSVKQHTHPVVPAQRGSLASSHARIPGSSTYRPTKTLTYFLYAACTPRLLSEAVVAVQNSGHAR